MSFSHNEHLAVLDDDDELETGVEQAIALGYDLITSILDRAPFDVVQHKVDAGAPLWYQLDEDGTSALHAAAYVQNAQLVRYLIQKGALWNAVDNLHNTAGDIALSLNDEESYTLIRDAGIRSELLLTLLSSRGPPTSSPLSLVLKATDTTAAASQPAFLSSRLRYVTDKNGQEICLLKLPSTPKQSNPQPSGNDTSLDNDGKGEEVGVMMGWERGIMLETVRRLCDDHPRLHQGLRVLNVGFGLGIIDTFFQSLPTPPATHVIIEPHPDVLAHMRATGWYDRPGVHVLEGRWQDFVGTPSASETLANLAGEGFDVVYTDTFSEEYKDLHEFFGHLPDLLAGPEARFSFFNGLGATNALFYDVYTHVSELHLADIGLDVSWSDVDVFADTERWGTTREYFGMRLYRLPVARMREM